jgi:hypothetical protein
VKRHPFEWIHPASERRVFVGAVVLAIAAMVCLNVLGGPLRSAASPQAIVSYELVGTVDGSQAILAAWGAEGRLHAGLNLGLDYLFLFAYPLAIGLGCVRVGRGQPRRLGWLAGLGPILAWGLVLAGVLDAIENYSLIRILLGAMAAHLPALARWCALPKFLLVGVGLVYFVVGGFLALLSRSRQAPTASA